MEKIAIFLVYAPTISTAIWIQVRVTNANTASLKKALLQVNIYSLGICFVFKKKSYSVRTLLITIKLI